MKRLKEIRRETYGHDARAINRYGELPITIVISSLQLCVVVD